jgi:hypothetical protein
MEFYSYSLFLLPTLQSSDDFKRMIGKCMVKWNSNEGVPPVAT